MAFPRMEWADTRGEAATKKLLRHRFSPARHIPMECRLELVLWKKERMVVLLRRKFVCEILLCLGQIELMNQEEFSAPALFELPD